MNVTFDRRSPKVCLSLTERTIREDLAIVESEHKRVDLVEVRSDFLDAAELEGLRSFPRLAGVPAILAFRRRKEGGARDVAERERLDVVERALDGEWAFVDLEDDLDAPRLEAKAGERGAAIIRSFCDFSGVPVDLGPRLQRLAGRRDELPKATVTPRSLGDLLRILDATVLLGESPAILTGTGEWGFPSRVLPGRFASVLTYSSAGRVKAAPDDVDPQTLRNVYRIGETTPRARIYCVIGNPVLHSRSPWIHNRGFRSLGIDAVYIPIQVDRIEDFSLLAERLPIEGASVTVPHKEIIRSLLAASDASVDEAGACNTLVKSGTGWRGFNTDIAGFLAPLRARLGERLAGKRALVVGAGGAARAVVAGLASAGCSVTIANRTEPRAQALASQFRCEWARLADLDIHGGFEIVVQATSVGMSPNEGVDPLPGYRFSGRETVYELIYAPRRTLFVERAERAGCSVIGGREMLLQQAFAQFRLFTGEKYPQGVANEDF